MLDDYAQRGIISAQDLKNLLSSEHADQVTILDATFVLPGDNADPKAMFKIQRIGSAQFFDFKKAANPDSDLPNMLPISPDFQRLAVKLGICNDDLIVIYGQTGMVMGPARLWWMFRIFGHDRVVVLDGGLPAWTAAGFALNTDAPEPPSERGTFEAQFNDSMVYTKKQVEASLDNPSATIADARSPARFNGETSEPRPGMRAGHIQGSCNMCGKYFVDEQTGCLKTKPELKAIVDAYKLDQYETIIATCGSGITACMIVLVLFYVGRKNGVVVYDGSWSEWGRV